MDKDHQLYEVAYLVSPAYSVEEAQNFQQTLKNLVQSLGGFIDQEGEIFKRRLAYPIKKMREAHLGSFRFLLAGEKISEVQDKLKNSKEVLRHILVHTKRQPPRTIRTQVLKPSFAAPTAKPEKTLKIEPAILEPAADIAEIDKKLEEILGK